MVLGLTRDWPGNIPCMGSGAVAYCGGGTYDGAWGGGEVVICGKNAEEG